MMKLYLRVYNAAGYSKRASLSLFGTLTTEKCDTSSIITSGLPRNDHLLLSIKWSNDH